MPPDVSCNPERRRSGLLAFSTPIALTNLENKKRLSEIIRRR